MLRDKRGSISDIEFFIDEMELDRNYTAQDNRDDEQVLTDSIEQAYLVNNKPLF